VAEAGGTLKVADTTDSNASTTLQPPLHFRTIRVCPGQRLASWWRWLCVHKMV